MSHLYYVGMFGCVVAFFLTLEGIYTLGIMLFRCKSRSPLFHPEDAKLRTPAGVHCLRCGAKWRRVFYSSIAGDARALEALERQ